MTARSTRWGTSPMLCTQGAPSTSWYFGLTA